MECVIVVFGCGDCVGDYGDLIGIDGFDYCVYYCGVYVYVVGDDFDGYLWVV